MVRAFTTCNYDTLIFWLSIKMSIIHNSQHFYTIVVVVNVFGAKKDLTWVNENKIQAKKVVKKEQGDEDLEANKE